MYLFRNLHNIADKNLQLFPVLALVGPRQAGKTTLAKQLRPNWKYFDLESIEHYKLIAHDPELFFQQYQHSIIIDEAQEYPALFKILRGVIDAKREIKGRFILTGSSSPELMDNISESLAGRIATLNINTLKANEFFKTPLSSFYNIFNTKLDKKNIANITTSNITNTDMRNFWLMGGYPEPIIKRETIPEFYSQWMINYQQSYLNRDIGRLFPKLNKYAYQRFLETLSLISGTIINKSDLARSVEISESTIREYLQIAENTFLWRNINYFASNLKTIVKNPKGYIRDSGLLHHLLQITTMDDLLVSPIVGHSFESFVIEELIKGLEASYNNFNVYFYRTYGGTEIDLIVKGPFGILPIEIKMTTSVNLKQLKSLLTFVDDNNLPFGIVINQAQELIWLHQKILQLPVRYI